MAYPIEFLEHRIAPATIIAATSSNELLRFDSASPGTIDATITITGLLGTTGETLVGIDFRPATGGLYGFTVNDASQGQLYRIDPLTGTAAAIGTPLTDAALTLSKTAGYGFDFNPVADRIRVVNSDGENFRVNPNDGTLAGGAVDTDLTGGSVIHGSAYDRSFAGAAQTTLFGIDVNTDQLVLQGSVNGTPNSPNTGIITNVGALGVNATTASFDIANSTGIAFASLLVGSTTGLYTINLTSGTATSVGDIGTGTSTLVGLAVETEQIRIVNPKTATFTDVDGDTVTIKITKGELTPGLFELGAGPNGGAYLRLLNLSNSSFAGTNVTITAKPSPNGGDKLVSVGYINATGNDLGIVKVSGDLTQIDAGNGDGGLAMKSLTVYSFGAINPAISATDLISTIDGALTKLTVKKDFRSAQLSIVDTTLEGGGRLGSLVVGGSIVGGSVLGSGSIVADEIGLARVARNIEGGSGVDSGRISAFGIDSLTVGGALIGGSNEGAGQITSDDVIGKVVIKGGIIGGSDSNTGLISASENINSLTVGTLVGGTGNISGTIKCDSTIKNMTVKGSIIGGFNSDTGTISAEAITKLTVGKSIIGTDAFTATVTVDTSIGSVKIGANLTGNSAQSGRIFAEDEIGNVVVGGSVTGADDGGGVIESDTIGNVSIKGSLVGTDEDSGSILADSALGKVVIGGNVVGSTFSAGQIEVAGGNLASVSIRGSMQGGGIVAEGDIGTVAIGGDVSGSNEAAIAAGGSITSITIKGSLNSGNGTANLFANSLGRITVGGNVFDSQIESNEGGIGPVKVNGSVVDSAFVTSGDIRGLSISGNLSNSFDEGSAVFASGKVNFVKVKGSILAGADGADIVAGVLGPVTVGGSIAGNDAHRINITAVGTQATTGTADLAIASVTVAGRIENTNILAGYSLGGPVNADAQIGKVSVGSDWVRSNLVAGVSSADAVFGNGDDIIIGEVGQVTTIVARIAGITIKGSVVGTFGGTDGFAFTAEEIKAVSIGGVKVKLEAGASNDDLATSGATQDVRIREASIT
jgi:Domain of unknown function (DUF4394)